MKHTKMVSKFVALGLAAVLGLTTLGAELPIAKTEAASTVAINKTNFPDASFRKSLKTYYDKNKDNRLSTAELKEIKNLYLLSYGSQKDSYKDTFYGIKNVKGVQKLKYLQTLSVFGTNSTKVDCSSLSLLKTLNMGGCNKLTSVNVKGLKKLTSISIDSCNKIKGLDVTSNPNLKEVNCTYSKNFKTLKTGAKNTKLSGVYVYGENVSSLDVSKLKALKKLKISNTQIDLDKTGVVNKAQITYLGISGAKKNADTNFAEYPALTDLEASDLGLTQIDLSVNSKLTSLEVEDNNLSNIDLSKMNGLKWLRVAGNKELKSLNVSNASGISYMSVDKGLKITLPNREYYYTEYYNEETDEYYDEPKVITISNPYEANEGSLSLDVKNSKDSLYIYVDGYDY